MELRSLSVSGLVVALVGFGLTRFTVSLAAMETRTQFFFGGLVPLALGLSLAAAGVVLAIGRYPQSFVRTVTGWCLVGVAAMTALVVLTILGSNPGALMNPEALQGETILSNFLIAGAVGGTLTGVYAGRNMSQRTALRQQANRLVLLNRLLRDEVINAAAAIKGHTRVLRERENPGSLETIERQADSVVDAVESVKYLTDTGDGVVLSRQPVDVGTCLANAVASVREEFPTATYTVETDTDATVLAGPHLEEVFTQLVRNAVEHDRSDEPHVSVTTETSRDRVTVSVRDDGPGLPERQQALLETGRIAEFDDPTTGFGLNIVRLLAESFGASVGTTVGTDGTTVSLELTRTDTGGGSRAREHGVPRSRLGLAVGAGLLAGVAMAATMQAFEGLVGVVGALYGIRDPLVGVVTHEFHSVVFALGYAGLLSVLPVEYSERPVRRLGAAVALSITLWAGAAGVVMPLWLEFVSAGVALPVPNLTLVSLLGHVSWGLTVGAVYYVGERWLLSRAQERSGRSAVTT